MDNRDFLDGIDEHFQRLMKQQGNGNGKGNGRASPEPPQQSVTAPLSSRFPISPTLNEKKYLHSSTV